jgi:antitoxin component of RelBE/YafQ-DinJ toxin-antitoxin module
VKTAKDNRDDVRESTFTVTATRAEKEAIQKVAHQNGLTMSAWVRMVLAEKINQK